MKSNTDYKVRVIFETALGNLEDGIRNVSKKITGLGKVAGKAGREGSGGLDDISASARRASGSLNETGITAQRVGSVIKKALAGAAVAYAGKQIADFGMSAANEYGKTQKSLAEMSSLGYKDLKTLEQAATDFSDTWAGTNREDFISAAYDIKSGIASLSDEGVARFTEMAGITAKATKATTDEMTSLFATGYGIYRDFYSSDEAFGEAFSAGISKSVQQFKTKGSEMASAISTLGASASTAQVPLEEQLSVLGMLQATMSGSEAGTKYRAFLQNTAKAGKTLGLDFLDANNQLRTMPEILMELKKRFGETLDANAKIEIKNAFGSDEAVAVIDLLLNKTEDLQTNIDSVADSMSEGVDFTETMADSMNNSLPDKLQLIRQNWANLQNEIGRQMEPGLSPVLDDIALKLQEMRESGDFSLLGESIGKLVQVGGELFSKLLDRAPGAVNALTAALAWLADNFDLIVFAVKTFIQVWAGFKAATVSMKIFKSIGDSAVKLTGYIKNCGGVIKALKIALKTGFKANPLGAIITLVMVLVSWFLKATEGVSGFKNKCLAAFYDIQIKFQKLVLALKKGMRDVADFFGIKLKGINDSIAKTESKIDETQRKKDSVKDRVVSEEALNLIKDGLNSVAGVVKKESEDKSSGEYYSTANGYDYDLDSSNYGSTEGVGGGSSAIDERIGNIESKYAPTIENLELKADLAEGDNKTAEAKSFKEKIAEVLRKQASDLLSLENTQSGTGRTLVENARLNIMKKIQEITADIRDGISSLTGEFNTPSDIRAMTKYEYMLTQGETGKRIYFGNSNVEMNFNIKNPDALSPEQLREYIINWGIVGAVTTGGTDYSTAKEIANQGFRFGGSV